VDRQEVTTIWVAVLYISPATAAKIVQKHGVTVDELRSVLVGVGGLRYTWDDDHERGLRAIVETWLRGRQLLAVLYPAADPFGDAWHLGSAYFTDV
jgi:hypothetical protein